MPPLPTPRLRVVNPDPPVDPLCPICHFIHHAQDAACANGQPQENKSTFLLTAESPVTAAGTMTSTQQDRKPTLIKAKITVLQPKQTPSLRHKTSTREFSLRDLRRKQSQQWSLHTKSSEDQLQQVYEAQIRAYLGTSVLAELAG